MSDLIWVLVIKKNFIIKQSKIKPPFYIYKAHGCKACNFKGYSGRIGISEVIKMTDNLAKMIVGNSVETEILKEARNQGMTTITEDGILKVLQGITSMEEVMKETEEV